jgi:RNA polymerase sigma factor (sigma-70 family)
MEITGPKGDGLQITDAELANRARGGDASAYAQLIRRHERSMLGLAYACTGCAETAADVTQDAFFRCWQRIEELREADRFVPWVATTVRNLSSNAMRSPARRMRLVGDELLDASSARPNEDPTAQGDRAARISAAIAKLDPTSAAVVTLRYFEELSSKQIGEMLDLSPAAVDMRLSRARAQLRDELKAFDAV